MSVLNLEVITHTPTGKAKDTPLLFVHGILHGAWCWENFLPYFAEKGYIASALSLQGHGNSPIEGSLRWKRIKDYVGDVTQVAADLAEQYGKRPVIIGAFNGRLYHAKISGRT